MRVTAALIFPKTSQLFDCLRLKAENIEVPCMFMIQLHFYQIEVNFNLQFKARFLEEKLNVIPIYKGKHSSAEALTPVKEGRKDAQALSDQLLPREDFRSTQLHPLKLLAFDIIITKCARTVRSQTDDDSKKNKHQETIFFLPKTF